MQLCKLHNSHGWNIIPKNKINKKKNANPTKYTLIQMQELRFQSVIFVNLGWTPITDHINKTKRSIKSHIFSISDLNFYCNNKNSTDAFSFRMRVEIQTEIPLRFFLSILLIFYKINVIFLKILHFKRGPPFHWRRQSVVGFAQVLCCHVYPPQYGKELLHLLLRYRLPMISLHFRFLPLYSAPGIPLSLFTIHYLIIWQYDAVPALPTTRDEVALLKFIVCGWLCVFCVQTVECLYWTAWFDFRLVFVFLFYKRRIKDGMVRLMPYDISLRGHRSDVRRVEMEVGIPLCGISLYVSGTTYLCF